MYGIRTAIGAALLLLALSACSPVDSPAPAPSSTPTQVPQPTETAAAAIESFTMPTACLDILPEQRLTSFDAEGLVLLGGPDGRYGDEYLADRSPEQRAGGITCIWGPPSTEISSVTISVAPLAASTRPAVVSDLSVNQGLNESVGETATYYWQLGDQDHQPAILNVLAADSWISIIETVGGSDNYTEAETLAAEVHELVYSAS